MKNGPFRLLLALSAFIFLITGCSKKDGPTGPKEDALISGDYFPTDHSIMWRYSSNAISRGGQSFIEFDMNIGSYTYSGGSFKAMLGKLADSTTWGPIMAIKDSAGVIYSLGDNPPESPYPLFKHQYNESEVTRETITVNGKAYETLKKVLIFDSDSLSLWFADSIGLVREFSRQGMSLFSDNNMGKQITVKTELIRCEKPKLVHILNPFGDQGGPVSLPE